MRPTSTAAEHATSAHHIPSPARPGTCGAGAGWTVTIVAVGPCWPASLGTGRGVERSAAAVRLDGLEAGADCAAAAAGAVAAVDDAGRGAGAAPCSLGLAAAADRCGRHLAEQHHGRGPVAATSAAAPFARAEPAGPAAAARRCRAADHCDRRARCAGAKAMRPSTAHRTCRRRPWSGCATGCGWRARPVCRWPSAAAPGMRKPPARPRPRWRRRSRQRDFDRPLQWTEPESRDTRENAERSVAPAAHGRRDAHRAGHPRLAHAAQPARLRAGHRAQWRRHRAGGRADGRWRATTSVGALRWLPSQRRLRRHAPGAARVPRPAGRRLTAAAAQGPECAGLRLRRPPRTTPPAYHHEPSPGPLRRPLPHRPGPDGLDRAHRAGQRRVARRRPGHHRNLVRRDRGLPGRDPQDARARACPSA